MNAKQAKAVIKKIAAFDEALNSSTPDLYGVIDALKLPADGSETEVSAAKVEKARRSLATARKYLARISAKLDAAEAALAE